VIRLVATDVDGTLIDHEGQLPDARRLAVLRLVEAGVPVVLATGKIWPSIRGLWTELGLPGPHVACNGAAVVAADGTVHAISPLAEAVAEEVAARLEQLGVPHATYLEDGTIVTPSLSPALEILPILGEPPAVVGRRDGRRVLKVLAVVDPDAEGDLRTLAADDARVQRTSHRFLEWNGAGVDKAAGLRTATEILGIDLSDVVAIGDAENDLPMLLAAGLGVAVQEASAAAVNAADLHLWGDLTGYLDELAATAETVSV
jgi:5-amino-6-(5-phospho-D-ribitylamino)uracil phosphatase